MHWRTYGRLLHKAEPAQWSALGHSFHAAIFAGTIRTFGLCPHESWLAETPSWETDFTTTPSPHHPIAAKGVGESPNVGGVSAFSNAVNDAFAHIGLTHTQMPHDHWRVWKTAERVGLNVA